MEIVKKIKVVNMIGYSGKKIPNQFVITAPEGQYFQSYSKIIVFKPIYRGNEIEKPRIILDEHFWDYSKTTGKYRNMFLGESKKVTEAKIKSGEYKLMNFN